MYREFEANNIIQFKKTIILSVLWHIIVFSAFSLTFAKRIMKIDYSSVSFLGDIFLPTKSVGNLKTKSKHDIIDNIDSFLIGRTERNNLLLKDSYFKPLSSIELGNKKVELVLSRTESNFLNRKKEISLMFYPRLPDYFTLYFKDRQIVHIELLFEIMSSDRMNSVLLKRKISSGNLEVDLLAMRYIGHYLFIQQTRFSPNTWQKIKIELSPQNK